MFVERSNTGRPGMRLSSPLLIAALVAGVLGLAVAPAGGGAPCAPSANTIRNSSAVWNGGGLPPASTAATIRNAMNLTYNQPCLSALARCAGVNEQPESVARGDPARARPLVRADSRTVLSGCSHFGGTPMSQGKAPKTKRGKAAESDCRARFERAVKRLKGEVARRVAAALDKVVEDMRKNLALEPDYEARPGRWLRGQMSREFSFLAGEFGMASEHVRANMGVGAFVALRRGGEAGERFGKLLDRSPGLRAVLQRPGGAEELAALVRGVCAADQDALVSDDEDEEPAAVQGNGAPKARGTLDANKVNEARNWVAGELGGLDYCAIEVTVASQKLGECRETAYERIVLGPEGTIERAARAVDEIADRLTLLITPDAGGPAAGAAMWPAPRVGQELARASASELIQQIGERLATADARFVLGIAAGIDRYTRNQNGNGNGDSRERASATAGG